MAARLRNVGRRAGLSVPRFAYRFILDNPGVTTVLGGFSTMEQFDELVTTSELPPIDPDVMSRVEDLWRTNFGG
jgi:L-glyceraldehyde 3-phosphate reductase